MLELKLAQFLPKVAKMYPKQYYLKLDAFENSPKITESSQNVSKAVLLNN